GAQYRRTGRGPRAASAAVVGDAAGDHLRPARPHLGLRARLPAPDRGEPVAVDRAAARIRADRHEPADRGDGVGRIPEDGSPAGDAAISEHAHHTYQWVRPGGP